MDSETKDKPQLELKQEDHRLYVCVHMWREEKREKEYQSYNTYPTPSIHFRASNTF